MKTLKLTMAMGVMLVVVSAFAEGTFVNIPFNTPIYSADDPLGVQAIQAADTKASNAATSASEAATAASNAATAASEASTAASAAQSKADATEAKVTAIETSMETVTNSMTKVGDTVVVGSMKGTPQDVGLLAGTNSIVLAVDKDSDEINPEDGQILLAADKIKFDSPLSGIFFGSTSLESLLAESGQGEVNTIVTVKTNGVALVPDSNRAIDIIIPSAGEGNVIESITTNGVALPINGKTIELPNYVLLSDLQDGITFNNMTVSNLTINGKKPSLEGHTHDDKLDATNGVAFGDLKVYPMPSGMVGQTHTIITHESMSIGDVEYKEDGITYNGETYEFSSDTNGLARLKDIPTISTNGVAITPDASKNINITIPSAGEGNVIESITTNGVALPVNGKSVEIPLQDYVKLADLQEGITFDNMTVSNLTINGKQPSLEGHTHTVSDIDGLDSYKNPTISAAALVAIDGINNAEDIATIKSSLTNFLHQFVIQPQQ